MPWRKYYKVECVTKVFLASHARDPEVSWGIYTNDNCENPDQPAYDVEYRTEKLAIRGAERLYRRVVGEMEEAIGLTNE